MRLTSLSDYAVVLLAAAARRAGGVRLSATALAVETGVPLPTAQKLAGRLAAAGLLETSRGAAGGFRLARGIGDISLADIIEAVEGPIAMTVCLDETRHDCALEGACAVRPHMGIVNQAVRGALAAVSLEQLANPPAHPELVPSTPPVGVAQDELRPLAEGLPFSSPREEGQGFDRLSLSGSKKQGLPA